MGEKIKISCSGTKKGLRRLEKSFSHFVKRNKKYDIISVSDYYKIKKRPWLCSVTIVVEDNSNASLPRARPNIICVV